MNIPDIVINFELDASLDYFTQEFKHHSIYTLYPETKEILRDIEFLKSSKGKIISGNLDFFEIPITIGLKKDFYNIIWDIEKIKKHLASNKKQIFKVDIQSLKYDETSLNAQKLLNLSRELPNFKKPIILVKYDIIGLVIVIDGNHRCYLSSLSKVNQINAITLSFTEMYEFLFSDYHKKLFSLHFNLNALHHFCNTPKKAEFQLSFDGKLKSFQNKAFVPKF